MDVVVNYDDVVGVVRTEKHGDGFRQRLGMEVTAGVSTDVERFSVRHERKTGLGVTQLQHKDTTRIC